MLALKLSSLEKLPDATPRATRRPIRAEAYPLDYLHPTRIHQALELMVTERRDDGLTASSMTPVWPGQRVALNFGNSPFLPRAGTVALIDECRVAEDGNYELSMSFESVYAA